MKTITNTIYVAFALFAFACFALLPAVKAVDPPPDGGYPGGNTAEGENAFFSGGGTFNTAVGLEALYRNVGVWNTAIGTGTLHENQGGAYNTATGTNALWHNTTGDVNTAIGTSALYLNTIGIRNTAIGYEALLNSNPTSRVGLNTATGAYALHETRTGIDNTANGDSALYRNTIGSQNTGIGRGALFSNTTGSNNTAIGYGALSNLNNLLTTGSNNIALGANAGSSLTNGSNNINIGNMGVAGESGKIRIGTAGAQNATFIAGIRGVTVAGGVGVICGANGQLGTIVSSARFKEAIKPMDKLSEAILALKPVTFRYKHELDPDGIPQFGLIAEQVEKVNPDLVARDADGKVNTVRYEAVNAMLLNEFLKEHRKVQELEANAASQQKEIKALTAALEEQASQIQKVSAQIQLSKPAPQTVLNNR